MTALLILAPEVCVAYAYKAGLPDRSPAALVHNAEVHALIQAGIDQANAKMARVEQVKEFAILPATWEPGGDELPPTLKLKRKPIATKYAAEIEALYG